MGEVSLSPCAGCNSAEAKIRALLDHITKSFLDDPAKFLGFEIPKSGPADYSELFHRWVRKFETDADSSESRPSAMCPDLKKRIEALVYELLSERYGVAKRKREPASDMLASLRCFAANPSFDRAGRRREGWVDEVLRARKALFRRDEDGCSALGLPFLKKQKTHKFLRATDNSPGSPHLVNEPIRRSKRALLKIGGGEFSRKRIPLGPFFQADVPEWAGPPSKKDLLDDTYKWLGTKLWPIEGDNRQFDVEVIGKGRSDSCDCTSRGSVECIRFHLNKARFQFKSELGPAFFSLGFDDMGEEVSKSWTQEEQMTFDDLVRQNPSSEGKSFFEPALEYFTAKSRRDIVSFYFNVFVLRWMSIRTRLGAWTVDSCDDENFG
ncbi:uncharacterized protein A4U43_C08F35740 [Asparagus officinalis]|uniref:AT-rich interactive domain-containing protein 2-like n=1 Tax=Asparagus officinalis TaxID=4686 RepID=UPI00098DFD4E|nr:AT-rich interactive domain-containing protein 2-like [Asparagus officinalis]XP_020241172.1 AT-rich interactive domain-containing protein 2-like [Asparagus officinalis]XP_020241173.1 AT-rich interactive domain-containing protein 2-like [Asparagus officinalis]XP_020241174.1 AT-rich interactive domain-containing protein 2-like [Asparagus officinalis]ONK61997.1 uncharacterized protein A4U43_C08F35740 [Asparagus officinalis]